MNTTQMADYLNTMRQAIKEGKGIIVSVSVPELPEPEIIINRSLNVSAKKEYYASAYDEQARLKTSPRNMIIGVRLIDDSAPLPYN